uniref:Tissue factor pathway inhibitor n=1 Tax=Culicoides nubeculosus TaxID=144565 RepID=B9URL9_CULNU|nr:tissue factor pathway inhibitor [Culicoides nubeculosus]
MNFQVSKQLLIIASIQFIIVFAQNRTPKREWTPPSICRGGMDRGDCNANVTRYFYNNQTKKCEEFSWSACGGNNNNFVELDSCRRQCEAKVPPRLRPELKKCFMKPDGGVGRAILKSFYYNPKSRRCEEFEYGGLGGNENNFETKENCEEECKNRIKYNPKNLRVRSGIEKKAAFV